MFFKILHILLMISTYPNINSNKVYDFFNTRMSCVEFLHDL